jgi:hypothetical protein
MAGAGEGGPARGWRLGDRYDGRLLRTLSPIYQVIPYIMRTRGDAHDYFEDRIDIGPAEDWLRRQRAAGHADLGYLALFMAALVRTISQRPRLNRFVAGQRIYARHEILLSLAFKKRLHEDSPETAVKLRFDPRATVYDVARVIEAGVSESKGDASRNVTDRTARIFTAVPGVVLRGLMALLRTLDYLGVMPRAIHRASPFHATAFVTDLGSLGIRPIYHHLYEFGTVSLFLAFGAKEREHRVGPDGRIEARKYISIKVVNDERICDGHYYASAFKYLLGLFRRPELLEVPPERVVEDQD